MYTDLRLPASGVAHRLLPRVFTSEADYFPDHVPLTNNATFHLYSFARGLGGVDQRANYLYVNITVVCFLVFAFGFLILRISKMVNAHLRHLSTVGSTPNQRFWAMNQTTWWPWIKKNIEYAPLWSVRHNREIQLSSAVNVGTLPSRFHTCLLASLFVSNIAYALVLPWQAREPQDVIAALRGRTGVLAAINMIPLVLFAGRNNPFIALLHVSYDTYNLLHRWLGRIVVLEALIHTFCWLSNTLSAGGMAAVREALANVPSYHWGLVATCVMTFMVLVAWSPIRHAFYETFLAVHKVLAVLALIGVYIHIADHELPQMPWIQLIFLIWGYEYFNRLARIIYYNFGLHRVSRITVEALPSEACRVTVKLARPWRLRPGCHAHIYLPSVAMLTSHPFSIAWASDRAPELRITEDVEKGDNDDREIAIRGPSATASSVSFVVRARTGFTRALYDRAARNKSRIFSAMGFIEGPYGHHAPLNSYGTVLLFAGGVGITHQVSFVHHLVSGYCNGTVSCRRILLVWSVANTECLEWVRPWMDEILRIPGRRECLRIKLFITKPRSPQEMVSGTGTVQMYPGRCNPGTIIDTEMKDQVGSMAVTVCGPGAFSDGVRDAARHRVEDGSLDFFEEAFTY